MLTRDIHHSQGQWRASAQAFPISLHQQMPAVCSEAVAVEIFMKALHRYLLPMCCTKNAYSSSSHHLQP